MDPLRDARDFYQVSLGKEGPPSVDIQRASNVRGTFAPHAEALPVPQEVGGDS